MIQKQGALSVLQFATMSEQEKEDKKKSHAHSEQRLEIRQLNVTRKKLSRHKNPKREQAI